MTTPTGQYIEIKEGSRKVRRRPRVYLDDGNMTPVTDAWLIENDSIYPVHVPEVAEEVEFKGEMEWTVLADKVVKTYWTVTQPQFSSVYQKLVEKPQAEWTYTATHVDKYDVVDIPLASAKALATAKLAATRYNYEVGGMNYGQLQIHTDRDSQAKLTSNFVAIMANLITTDIEWKTVGGFVTFTPADYQTMAATALGFVQACYNREKEVGALIAGATTYAELVTAYAEIDTGYPAIAVYGGE